MAQDRALRRVLELRQDEEKAALEAWSAASATVRNYENQIAQIKAFRDSYAAEMTARTAGGMDMNVFMSYQNFLNKLDDIARRQEQALERLREEEETQRLVYLDKQKNRKIIESLLEKHREAQRKAEEVAERKLADDLVSAKQARLLMERRRQKA